MADGFVIGQPGYANLDDFLEALDRTIPGTGPQTTPAYLFGRPDSDWVDSNSFLMVTTDAGGNTDVLFLNASDLDMEAALAPSNGYLIDTDDDGTPDSLSQQFYYDRALGVLQNLTWHSLAMPFASVSTDGIQVVTNAVYAEFRPGKWVAGIRTDINAQMDFVVNDPEFPELGAVSIPVQAASLEPRAYVTDKAAAITWAQFLANVSPFLGGTLQTATVNIGEWSAIRALSTAGADPEEVFVELEAASVDEYRNAIAAGAGIVEESVTANGYTIIDGDGNAHYLMPANSLSCGEDCALKRSTAFRDADRQYEKDMRACSSAFLDDLKGTFIWAGGCCTIGVGIAVATSAGVLAPQACLAGAVICGMTGGIIDYFKRKNCRDDAESDKEYRYNLARQAWAACCANCDEDDPECHPEV